MLKKIQHRYQQLILRDINSTKNAVFKRVFPWILVSFFVIQVAYYFVYFHSSIRHHIALIKAYHLQYPLLVWPKTIVFTYDHVLVFMLYLFFIVIFLIISFVAFDFSQRNEVIRRLQKKIAHQDSKQD